MCNERQDVAIKSYVRLGDLEKSDRDLLEAYGIRDGDAIIIDEIVTRPDYPDSGYIISLDEIQLCRARKCSLRIAQMLWKEMIGLTLKDNQIVLPEDVFHTIVPRF